MIPTQEAGRSDPTRWLPFDDLDRLLEALRADGRTIIGPVVRDEAIILDEITSADDLPAGRGAETAPGRYRLTRREDARRFDHAVGPMSPKRWTFPPRAPIRVGKRTASGVRFARFGSSSCPPRAPRRAGLRARRPRHPGSRPARRPAIDGDYRARRAATFVVAVECATPTSTCFCTSMGTGPEVDGGLRRRADRARRGLRRADRIGGRRGVDRVARPRRPPIAAARKRRPTVVAGARRAMGVPTSTCRTARAGLAGAPDHPRWAAVAERCLGCTNCTLVCPTCFCTSVVQTSDLDGTTSTDGTDLGFLLRRRVRQGGRRHRSGRTAKDRYRQWLTHKFSTWWDQFGSSGCVGCGRCIAWCPVGIDVREELAVIAGDRTPSRCRRSPPGRPCRPRADR